MRILLALLCGFQCGLCFGQKLHIDSPVKLLALGDSYTIGQSVPINDRWPVQLMEALRLRGMMCDDPRIIATSGWRTDDLKNAVGMAQLKNEYNLVSLLIGVNNYYQGRTAANYQTEFDELLKMAIALAKGQRSNVFVLSIPDYGYTPFGKLQQSAISTGIDVFNGINEEISNAQGVAYINITDISRLGLQQPDLVAGDGLHPSRKQYERWIHRILADAVITGAEDNPVDTLIAGLEEQHKEISVYPNPFVDHLFIGAPAEVAHPALVTLTDAMGRVVLARSLNDDANPVVLNTQDLASGIYVYRILYGEGEHVSGRISK